jgi:transposase
MRRTYRYRLYPNRAQVAALESQLADACALYNAARGTSQACSACGQVVQKSLGERTHRCTCGYQANRDVNAARNILARGLGWSLQAQTVGAEVRAVA